MSTSSQHGRSHDRLATVIGGVLAVLIVVVVAVGIWRLARHFSTMPRDIIAPVLIALITGVGSLAAVLFSKRAEHRRDIEEELRKQKIPVYQEFMEFLFRVVLSGKDGRPELTDLEMRLFLQSFAPKLIVWGSDGVVKAYVAFRAASIEGAGTSNIIGLMATVEAILCEIRRDMGHANKNLGRGDLLAIFINDIHNYIRELEANAEFNKCSTSRISKQYASESGKRWSAIMRRIQLRDVPKSSAK